MALPIIETTHSEKLEKFCFHIAYHIKSDMEQIDQIRKDHEQELRKNNPYQLDTSIEPYSHEMIYYGISSSLIKKQREMLKLRTQIDSFSHLLYYVGLDLDWDNYNVVDKESKEIVFNYKEYLSKK